MPDAPDPRLVAERLAELQRRADVARSLGAASRNAYASYEQGQREPTLGKFRELLRAVAPGIALVLEPRASAAMKRPLAKARKAGKAAA